MQALTHTFFHAILLASLLTISHSLLKWVSIQKHTNYFNLIQDYWYIIATALLMYGFIFFYYIYVLKNSSLSSLYPIYTGLSIILVLLSGKFFFNEVFNLSQTIGAILIVFGILLILNK